MAFKGLRFAGLEWRSITASKIMWVVVAAIAIIPLLYGALYLAAFQDPYGRLDAVPVAVVNEDAGAVIAAESRNLGDDVVDDLKRSDDGLGWHFVSADQAQAGLEDGTYFMTCTIPSDFSASVASVDGDAPRKAQLKVEYNQSENMLASQIGETVWKQVRKRVSDTVAAEYWETVLGRVADSGRALRTAADGAGALEEGLATAEDGSREIAADLGALAGGARSLEGGLGTLASGAGTLQGGAESLATGTQALQGGAGRVASGLGELQQQTSDLPALASRLDGGVEALVGSVDAIAAGIGADGDASDQTFIGGINQVSGGLSRVSGAADGLAAGLDALATGVGTAQAGVGKLNADANEALAVLEDPDKTDAQKIAAAKAALDGIASGTAPGSELAAGLAQARSSLEDPGAGAVAAARGIADSTGASGPLQGGLAEIKGKLGDTRDQIEANGPRFAQLAQGAAQLSNSSGELVSAIGALDDGAARLGAGLSSAASGARELDSGASQLAAGAANAQGGSSQLASGAAQLQEGSAALVVGLHGAVGGAGELEGKLAEGAQTAADQTADIPGKSAVMSDPVELANDFYTTVKNYGTGFAPYFMALGLWVGGLVAGFVFKPLNGRLILAGANPVTAAFANFLPWALFALIQATLLMVVLQFGLQLQIDNVPAFYAMGYFAALVFAAIMQFLMAAFGFPGRFLAIILLMLQLTSSAGTFPIQTTPAFFQVVSPFMPMTYVVAALRQIMTGLDYAQVAFDCTVLAAIGIGSFALTCLVAWRKRTVRMDDLHPVLQLG